MYHAAWEWRELYTIIVCRLQIPAMWSWNDNGRTRLKAQGEGNPQEVALSEGVIYFYGEEPCPVQPGNRKPATHLKMQDAINTQILWHDGQIV